MTDEELRLLGSVAGKRVLELGCSDAESAIALAGQGAHVIAIADGADDLDRARTGVERAEAKVELHHGDLADLAFIRADTVDAAFSDGALRDVEDLDRVFRQVHRVLKTDAPLLVSLPHPTLELIDEAADPALLIRRSYFDRSDNRRTVGDLFTSLTRAHFAVDTLLEPDSGPLPRTLILRGRKLGN
ncbi:MAG: Methyltransferase domain [Actinomycetia bacterium]|nr:Methyltransferase domain [Actinomycetes bacterium]